MLNTTELNGVTPDQDEKPELISLSKFAQQLGRTSVTIWRWRTIGWLDGIINIAGKPYITRAGMDKFYRRAEAGEFSKPSHAPKRTAAPEFAS